MQRDTLAPLVIGIVVVLAIVGGLSITGGPTTARAERRDMARLDDLRTLMGFVRCVAEHDGRVPITLAPVKACGTNLPLADRVTDRPYRYEALPDTAFKLCAEFERPDLIRDQDIWGATWQAEQGCFTFAKPH